MEAAMKFAMKFYVVVRKMDCCLLMETKQINACLDRRGSLWQPAYHDHGIRRDESLNAIIEYCYHNPVRAGLVKAARDYPFWRCKYEME